MRRSPCFFPSNRYIMNMTNKGKKKKIPAKVLFDAQLLLDDVKRMLEPYLVVLTQEERQDLVNMGVGAFKFLEKSHEFAVEYPGLFPVFTEAELFKEEFFAVRELWTFKNKLNQLIETVTDTEMTASGHALKTALDFYHTVKIAARRDFPGARVIYEELKPSLPVKKRS